MTKKEEREIKLLNLTKEKEYLKQQIDSIENVKKVIQFPDIVGLTVRSKKFHEGVITKFDGQYFMVNFQQGEKKYAFPDSIVQEFLELDDEKLVFSCKKYSELLNTEENLRGDLKKLEAEMVQVMA